MSLDLRMLSAACDAAEEGDCCVRLVVKSHTRSSSSRCQIAPGLVGDVVDRYRSDGGEYMRHVLFATADVRAFLARAARH